MKDYETLVRDIIQEENELKDRIIKLEYFMMTEDYQKISESQKLLLTKQLAAMNNYKGCLFSRVLQLRFEHALDEEKGCYQEPEKEVRLEPHVFSAMEYEAHIQNSKVPKKADDQKVEKTCESEQIKNNPGRIPSPDEPMIEYWLR